MGDGLIAGVEFGDPVKPLAALWLHATGFNAMTYQSILAPLGLRTRVAAIDLRGFGRSTVPADPPYPSWHKHRNDVIKWLEKHAPEGCVLGGHSMGGLVALLVAGKRPDLVKGLVLVDPVLLSRNFYMMRHLFPPMSFVVRSGSGLARQSRKRRATFASMQEAEASYQGRGAFSTWREPFLQDYLLDGIDRTDDNPPDSEDQTWSLLCTPKWESSTYTAQRNRPWSALGKVRRKKIPLTILRAAHKSVMSDKVADGVQSKVPAAQIKTVRGSTHFLPMEVPYAVRDELSGFISRLVEGFSAADEGPVRRTLR